LRFFKVGIVDDAKTGALRDRLHLVFRGWVDLQHSLQGVAEREQREVFKKSGLGEGVSHLMAPKLAG
jgi:hypothetical protein